ncbi:O-succinylhomoserine sulfhydrylase, partial [Rhizobium johnstonii]
LTDEARAELGISPVTVRLSAGIEDSDYLIEYFARALAKVSA